MTKSLVLWIGCGALALLVLRLPAAPAQAENGPTPTPATSSGSMNSPDTWMKPPPSGPTQADLGAYTYWMRCMVCHGDRGQGLAIFRYSYPKADQNCSSSKCHGGPNPGAGFSFPDAPAIMGPGTLARFDTAADLYAFVSAKMPYQAPGALPSEQYWALVAYLLKQHNALPPTIVIGPSNADSVPLVRASTPPLQLAALGLGAAGLTALVALVLAIRRRKTKSTPSG
ncbi:MAG: hypothetical protein M1482_07735 [Chloroflexi bacterium]|nr:hypothetical protein [Chloroflexota bacterium]